MKPRIVAFGNPLLDTIIFVKDNFLLKKYNLENDGQKEVTGNEMKSLKEDIRGFEKTVIAGGCAQNTLKIIQWLLKKEIHATIFGSIGNDIEGEVLKEILEKNGVNTNYVEQINFTTGATVSLVNGDSRSLVAYLGAAEILSLRDVKSNLILKEIERASLIYVEGFFLTKRIDAATFILNHCNDLNKKLAFNLSGEYLCREYTETVLHFLEKSSIIFGNRREFEALCTFMNESGAENLINRLGQNGKVVAMTDGPCSVICVGDSQTCKVEVPELNNEELVDTTGAGDSFVAGFLTGYLLKKPLESCAMLGCYAAQEIIKQRGCSVPEYSPSYNL